MKWINITCAFQFSAMYMLVGAIGSKSNVGRLWMQQWEGNSKEVWPRLHDYRTYTINDHLVTDCPWSVAIIAICPLWWLCRSYQHRKWGQLAFDNSLITACFQAPGTTDFSQNELKSDRRALARNEQFFRILYTVPSSGLGLEELIACLRTEMTRSSLTGP